jgi:hypothetical protein
MCLLAGPNEAGSAHLVGTRSNAPPLSGASRIEGGSTFKLPCSQSSQGPPRWPHRRRCCCGTCDRFLAHRAIHGHPTDGRGVGPAVEGSVGYSPVRTHQKQVVHVQPRRALRDDVVPRVRRRNTLVRHLGLGPGHARTGRGRPGSRLARLTVTAISPSSGHSVGAERPGGRVPRMVT